jgi:methyl-accepting chemotaxis protein
MKGLSIICLAGLVLALGAVGGLAQGDELCLNAAFGVAAVATLAETYVDGLMNAMYTLTATAELRTGDWETMRTLIEKFEQSSPVSCSGWFLRPDGTYYKVITGLVNANLSDRADPSLLLEQQSLCTITAAQGGIQISEVIGWTFVLGTSLTDH